MARVTVSVNEFWNVECGNIAKDVALEVTGNYLVRLQACYNTIAIFPPLFAYILQSC